MRTDDAATITKPAEIAQVEKNINALPARSLSPPDRPPTSPLADAGKPDDLVDRGCSRQAANHVLTLL